MKIYHEINTFLKFVGSLFLITTLSRVVLFFLFLDRTLAVQDWYQIFTLGFRLDFIMIGYVSILPLALMLLLPAHLVKKLSSFLRIYCIAILIAFLFLELITPQFIDEYDVRPNRLFIDYLAYPKEVFGMLGKGFLPIVIAVTVILILGIIICVRMTKDWIFSSDTTYWKKIILFLLIAPLLILAIRNTLGRRPANPSNAVFCSDQMVNNLPLNSAYNVFYAIYSMKNEADVSKIYGTMSFEKAFELIKKDSYIDEKQFIKGEIPSLHKQNSLHPKEKPYNLVILLQESLGAEYVGCLDGLPLTPSIDALSKEGQLFTNLYSSGTRSVQGIEAVTTGAFPTPSGSVVKLSKAQGSFFTLADLFKKQGYQTSFIYGGEANFDNMASFFSSNGFMKIIDEKDYLNYTFKGNWGVCDEDLYKKANETFNQYNDKPFFSLVFSSSNHTPFEFPDGKITLHDKEKATVNNAIKYADYSIGKFFEMAKKSPYYDNTIFIIIADHNTRTKGKTLLPIHKFKIPALIIGPNVPKQAYTKLCAQIDIAPTLLDYVGLNTTHPMMGRNLLQLPNDAMGRAIFQFNETHGIYREDGQVVVMQAGKKPKSFVYNETQKVLTPQKKLNQSLADLGLGQVIFASETYNNQSYILPK